MKSRVRFSVLILVLSCFVPSHAANVGLCVMATGKYIEFANRLVDSARKYFCTNHKVTYFIFTDGQCGQQDDVVRIEQKRLGWPHDTMMRFKVYAQQADLLSTMDYLFACDADMLFVAPVGDEILGERVATQHPGFVGKRGSYETKKRSLAYVARNEGKYYFAGGFYGGSAKEFFALTRMCSQKIEEDLQNNYIAVWHDESHLNRYFIDHKPTIMLTPSYCYPERWNLPYEKKLLALDKNHSQMRA